MMIDILDIKKSVNDTIKNNIDIKILSNSVKDNFQTPAIFTSIKPINFDFESRYRQSEAYNITVHYFPKKNNDEIELLKVMSELRNIFDRKLEIKDRKIDIRDVKESIHEGTLFFRFNIKLQQYKEVEGSTKMQEVVIKEE